MRRPARRRRQHNRSKPAASWSSRGKVCIGGSKERRRGGALAMVWLGLVLGAQQIRPLNGTYSPCRKSTEGRPTRSTNQSPNHPLHFERRPANHGAYSNARQRRPILRCIHHDVSAEGQAYCFYCGRHRCLGISTSPPSHRCIAHQPASTTPLRTSRCNVDKAVSRVGRRQRWGYHCHCRR